MRLTTFILIASLVQVSAASLAQRITLSQNKASLKQIFAEIKKQTGYDVFYQAGKVKEDQVINTNFSNTPLEKVMEQCLEGQPLTFTIDEKTVLIKEKNPSFLDKARAVTLNLVQGLLQDLVRGVVKDEQGNPLPNASIRVKGKNAVTNTNAKGEFEIRDVDEDAVLVISYVGYQRLEISVKNAMMPLEIKLNQLTGELEEVKVEYSTGYQELNRDRATGSFAHVDNELLNRTVSTNILDRLRGVVSGLNFDPRSDGTTGSPIKIRGISTIHANNQPLIVVDNFPYDGDITQINPNDILSVTVLKDAAAASIWGVRAGNGVIVITTKRGNFNQPTKVQFNSNVNIGAKPDLFYEPRMSSQEVIDFQTQLFNTGMFNTYDDDYPAYNLYPAQPELIEILLARRRGDLTQTEANSQISALAQHDVRNDVNKYLLQNSIDQQHALNFSGGSDRYKYYSSVGYDKNLSNNKGDKNSRLTLRLDNTYIPAKNLEVNGFLVFTQNKGENNGLGYGGFMNGTPYTKLADEQGNALALPMSNRILYVDTASYPGLLDWHYRPLDELRYADNTSKQSNIRVGTGAKYEIIPGLSTELRYQYERQLNNIRRYFSDKAYFTRSLINRYAQVGPGGTVSYPVPLGGIQDLLNSEFNSWNLRGQLNYFKHWGQSEFVVLAGLEGRETTFANYSDRQYGYDASTSTFVPNINYTTPFPLNPGPNSGTAVIPSTSNSNQSTINRYQSFYANGSYAYKSRYLVSASARLDRSNFFGVRANQRQVPLWSTGLSWEINRESFFKIDWLSSLKLRASYGYNGNTNNNATAFPTMTYSAGTNSLTAAQMAALVSPPNPQLRWERVKMINIGLDFEAISNRIKGSLEYYTKKGLDLISDINIDPTTGVFSYVGNNAGIKGDGIDIRLNTHNLEGNFKWTTNILFSYTTDKVVSYEKEVTSASQLLNITTPIIDKPLYKIYSYPWGGLSPINGNPQGIVAGSIVPWNIVTQGTNTKPQDMLYHGRSTPDTFGSLRNTLSLFDVTLSFNILYNFGYYFRRNSINYSTLYSLGSGHGDYAKRWQKPGDEILTNVPALPISASFTPDAFYSASEILIERGDHIRLQDIRLSYSLSKKIWRQLPVQNIQVYFYSNNVCLLWRANKLGIDPYFIGSSAPRTLAFGLNINI